MIRRFYHWLTRKEEELALPLRLFFGFNLACCILLSFQHIGYHQADEHFQISEFAWYLLGEGPAEELPWEFRERMRPALQPIASAAYFQLMEWVGMDSPYLMIWLMRICMSFVSMGAMFLMLYTFEKEVKSLQARRLLWGMGALLWFLPYLFIRFTAENTAAVVFMLVLYLLFGRRKAEAPPPSMAMVFGIGLLLGLCFVLRYQIAFALAGLGAWLLFRGRMGVGRLALMFLGSMVTVGGSVLLDSWFYGTLTVAPYQYYVANIVEKKAASFGVHPWYQYFIEMTIWLCPPLSILLQGLFFYGVWKKPWHVLTWCILPFLLAHIAVGHKELRFLFPLLYLFPLFIAIGLDQLPKKYHWKGLGKTMVRINMAMSVLMLYRPVYQVVDFNEYYQKFIYDYSLRQEEPLRIASFHESPYSIFDLEMNFYKPSRIELLVLDSLPQLTDLLQQQGTDHLLVNIRGYGGPPEVEGIEWECIYASFHPRMEHYNYFNWQQMVKLRYLYRPRRQELSSR
ncbi:MAG: hypothetical protein AAFV95_17010 [Bacteroidota bacterium]